MTKTEVDEMLRELLRSTQRQLELAGMDASPAALRAAVIEQLRSRCAQLGVGDEPNDAISPAATTARAGCARRAARRQ